MDTLQEGQRNVSEGHQEDTLNAGWHSAPTPHHKAQKIMGRVDNDKEIKARSQGSREAPCLQKKLQHSRETELDQGRQVLGAKI